MSEIGLARRAYRGLVPHQVRKGVRLRLVKTRFGTETVRNYVIDRRYGGWSGGRVNDAPVDGGLGFTAADYYMLRRLFSPEAGIEVRPDDVLVDVGCGKGRVLNFWLDQGWTNRIVGVELNPELAEWTRRRLAPWPNVEIVCADATKHVPTDGTIFFLFNPFGERLLRQFKDSLVETFGPAAPITIVYYFALKAHVFAEDPLWRVRPCPVRTFHKSVIVTMAGADPRGSR
jgi:SAM-dependent methyltransferase